MCCDAAAFCPANSVFARDATADLYHPSQEANCQCGANFFFGEAGCEACPANSGTRAPGGVGMMACSCAENFFATEVLGGLTCTACPAGSTSSSGAMGLDSCRCGADSFITFAEGLGSCQACPEGATAPVGSNAVEDCVCGNSFFGALHGPADSCTACPAGYSTSADAHAELSDCVPSIRLMGGAEGSPGCGSVMVFKLGQWGHVCDDSWTEVDAQVVCRQLGLVGGGVGRSGSWTALHRGTGPIWMDDVACSGTETTLLECPYNAQHNCGHTEDTSICCDTASFCSEGSSFFQADDSILYPPAQLTHCRCAEGFFADEGACAACPANSNSAAGSRSIRHCHCTTDHYLVLDEGAPTCQVCPTGSVAANGADNVAGCQCAAGSFMRLHQGEEAACAVCPPESTSEAGGVCECQSGSYSDATGAEMTCRFKF